MKSFVGKDAALALEYSNASKALMVHLENEDKVQIMMTDSSDSLNGNAWRRVDATVINASGLYLLILSSKLPQAREFKRGMHESFTHRFMK